MVKVTQSDCITSGFRERMVPKGGGFFSLVLVEARLDILSLLPNVWSGSLNCFWNVQTDFVLLCR